MPAPASYVAGLGRGSVLQFACYQFTDFVPELQVLLHVLTSHARDHLPKPLRECEYPVLWL
jgi:hypothetical protein